MDKKRDLTTGEVSIMGISRSVKGSDVVIVDDMIMTGGTMVETAKFLRKQKVRSITVVATHHLYVEGAQKALEESGINKIVVTDTISARGPSKKVTVLSTAGLISEEIKRLFE